MIKHGVIKHNGLFYFLLAITIIVLLIIVPVVYIYYAIKAETKKKEWNGENSVRVQE